MKELKLTPMSELYTDLHLMIDGLEKDDSDTTKLAAITLKQCIRYIDESDFINKERREIELACKAGLSGLPVSSKSYFDERFLNKNNVIK